MTDTQRVQGTYLIILSLFPPHLQLGPSACMWPTPTSLNSDTPSPPSPRPTSESMGSLVHTLKRKKSCLVRFPALVGSSHSTLQTRPLPRPPPSSSGRCGASPDRQVHEPAHCRLPDAGRRHRHQCPRPRTVLLHSNSHIQGVGTVQGDLALQGQPHTMGCALREAISFTGAVALSELSPRGKHDPSHMSVNKPTLPSVLMGLTAHTARKSGGQSLHSPSDT